MTRRSILFGALAVFALTVLMTTPATVALGETKSFSTERLTVRNMIGEIRIEAGGSAFEVIVDVQGKDAREGMIRIEAQEDEMDVVFPEGTSDFVYPKLEGNKVNFEAKNGGNWASKMIGGMVGSGKINVSRSGSGLEVWADVTIRVPSGLSLEVEHGVGKVVVDNADGDLQVSTRSGNVEVDGASGELSVATGSGDVRLARVSSVEAQVATGSGDVRADDFTGDELQVATGSGDVEVAMIRGQSVQVATGSGEIDAREVDSESVELATGSGDVTLLLDQMGGGEYSVGTGSGDIALTMPLGASADLHAETDGGEILVALGDAEFQQKDPDEVRLTVGKGGARVRLGSGNGDITIGN
jgi:DUF4097 and DUF4098 domain-containing protein YvlB